MIKINYDVCVGDWSHEQQIQVEPAIDADYIQILGGSKLPYLVVPTLEKTYWQWWLSYVYIESFDTWYQALLQNLNPHLVGVRPVVRHESVLTTDFYLQYVKNIFSSFRCGTELNEMLIKVQGYFGGADWQEDMARLTTDSKVTPLTCQLEVTHVTIQSFLPPYTVKYKKRLDVLNWKPKDLTNYAVVWHLQITLSNGEKYKMYYPIASLQNWRNTLHQYFETHPKEPLSPAIRGSVTTHPEAYDTERIRIRFQKIAHQIQGASVSEILLKLSVYFNFPERPVHLQKILYGETAELVFTGQVKWHRGFR